MAENVDVRLRLIGARKFRADAQGAGRSVGDIGDRSGRAAGQTDRLDKSSRKTRRGLMLLGTGAKYAGFALGGFAVVAGKRSIDAASSLNEEINKTRTVFAGSETGILKWSKTTDTALGLSQRAALEGAGSIGSMLVPMGLARSRAAGMSKEMVGLASDMASFNNEDPSEMLDRIRAGLSGESEPLKRFGATLNETRVKQHAWTTGLAENGEALTEKQKILGRYSLLLKDTKDQQGDFARTSKSWANVQRVLSAQFDGMAASLGARLVPLLQKGGTALSRFIGEMKSGKGSGGQFATTMKGIWEGVRPVAEWLGRAAKRVARFAGEHPNLVKFAVALGGIKLAASKLGGGLFSRAGSRGGGGFISGFKGGIGQFFGAKFGEYMLTKYGSKFRAAGRSTGSAMGGAAGTTAAKTTAATMAGGGAAGAGAGAAGGGLKGAMKGKATTFKEIGKKAGRGIGGGLASGIIAGLVFNDPIVSWLDKQGKKIDDKLGFNPVGDTSKNPLQGINPFRKGFWDLPGGANGGLVGRGGIRPFANGGLVPKGEDTLAGLRFGEFVMRKEAVSDIGIGRLRAMNAGRDNVTSSPSGGGRMIQVNHQTLLNGRVIAEEVSRHPAVLSGAVASDVGRQKGRR